MAFLRELFSPQRLHHPDLDGTFLAPNKREAASQEVAAALNLDSIEILSPFKQTEIPSGRQLEPLEPLAPEETPLPNERAADILYSHIQTVQTAHDFIKKLYLQLGIIEPATVTQQSDKELSELFLQLKSISVENPEVSDHSMPDDIRQTIEATTNMLATNVERLRTLFEENQPHGISVLKGHKLQMQGDYQALINAFHTEVHAFNAIKDSLPLDRLVRENTYPLPTPIQPAPHLNLQENFYSATPSRPMPTITE